MAASMRELARAAGRRQAGRDARGACGLMVKLMPGTKGTSKVTIPQRVHLVGAGGMHLSAIGQVLLHRGHTVTGSDITMTEYTERLRALGGTIYEGHAATNLGDAELVVATVAAGADNPELAAARERGIPIIVRAEMVQRLIADRDVLAIAGSHGKTTTTSLAALMTIRSELDPLVLSGGDSRELGGNARDGAGALAVIEADEYAEAFLEYEPTVAVITNVEPDHLDYYGTEARLMAAFSAFAKRVRPDGVLIACIDSPRAAEIAEARIADGARVERYALDHDAEWRAVQLRPNDEGGTGLHRPLGRRRDSAASPCACPADTTSRTPSVRSRHRCERAPTSTAPRSPPPSSQVPTVASSSSPK